MSDAAAIGKVAETRKTRAFVSYSRKDSAAADHIASGLRDLGFDAALDKTDIAPGEPWKERIGALIAAADGVAFVLSPASAASEICGWELGEALRLNKRVVPFVVHRVPDADAPGAIARLNYVFGDAPERFEAALKALADALSTDIGWIREHTRFAELARRWDDGGRGGARALRGADLDAAERWLAGRPEGAPPPTDLQRDFVAASRRAATTRLRAWIAGSLAVAAIAVGLSIFAYLQRNEAVRQAGIAVAATTEAVRQRDAADVARKEAVAQRNEAIRQRDRADRDLTAAIGTAQDTVGKLAIAFRGAAGMRVSVLEALLTGAEGLLERLAALNDATPALGMGRANALAMVAQTLARAGSKKAPETAKVALTLASKAVVEAPSDPDARHARGFAEEVEAEVDPGLSDDARLAFADRAAEDYRACASSSAPIGPQCLADEVNALGWKGNYLAGRGRFQEASVVYGAAAEVAREGTAGTADPKVKATMEREAAEIGLQNAVALQKLGRLDDALKSYGEAIAYFEGQGSAQVDNDVRIALGNAYNGAAATMLAKAGGQRLDRATATPILALLFKARDMILPIVRNDPGNLYWARNLVIVDSNVAAIDERIGDVADARRFDAEAAAISRNIKAAGG